MDVIIGMDVITVDVVLTLQGAAVDAVVDVDAIAAAATA